MDKKRRCLYGVEKKPNSIQSVENISLIEEEPSMKKNKNGRIVNIKIEEKILEDHSADENFESKLKSAEKTVEEKSIEILKEASIKDIKVEISNPKSQTKSKQRYENIHIMFIYIYKYICFLIYIIINLFQLNFKFP